MPSTVKQIIWDWNGTLLDDVAAGVNAINAMLAKRRLPLLTLVRYRELFGFPVRHFYEAAGFALDREDWDAMAREYHTLFLSDPTLRLHEGAREALAYFSARGIGQSILSVMEQTRLDRMLAEYGLTAFFQSVCGANNLYGISKIELGAQLLKTLGFPPEQLLMIGDTLHDAEVAKALGLPCVLIANGHQSHARLAASGCPVLRSLSALPAWFARI